ncbi:MAG: 4-hydroxy-tetrahydrodipicolinate synthase [Desulfovibrio sp.]|nr:4-hydroxy-tetrahydrodipicolinate synthase [Desulfovibrio sp.]
MMFTGAMTALVTPFKDNAIDEESYRSFIEWQIAEGIDGLVPCGTTGESATLSHAEHERAIEICIEQAARRVPVLAGSGSNNTAEAVALTRFAKKAGADGALLITPYYNKPSQQGLYEHYKTIAQAVDLPLIPYNVPTRTGCNMLPETIARLAKDFPNIVGLKAATGDMKQGSETMEKCPERFSVLSGDDLSAMPLIAIGARGLISVTSNIAPRRVAAMCKAALNGKMEEARKLHHELFPLSMAMFMVSNPTPVKTALAMLGKMSPEMRLPLCPMNAEDTAKLEQILRAQQLLGAEAAAK